ncbi:MAG TPA: HAD-IIA family hydrolase [Candidatus Lustribacter sp.]|nr:HAD-IIA family hydrolase [Candidatus Lustribacter sp.]
MDATGVPQTAAAWPSYEGAIFDLDGTIYRGDEPIPGAVDALNRIAAAGARIAFVTNNAMVTAEGVAAKLAAMGYPATPGQVVTSAAATAQILLDRHGPTRVYVIGAPALAKALTDAGHVVADSEVTAVVVGLDLDLTYAKLRCATTLILGGAEFVATNPDRLFPLPDGLAPGGGAIVAAVATAVAHVTTPFVVGKPETPLVEQALVLLGTARDRTLLVGDQIRTDILAAKRTGLYGVLVTTGAPQFGDDIAPDRVVASLSELPDPGRPTPRRRHPPVE